MPKNTSIKDRCVRYCVTHNTDHINTQQREMLHKLQIKGVLQRNQMVINRLFMERG